jgi:ParB family chromosome partitioning protein
MHAASILGMECVPAIIREMTDDEAVVKMVGANIQREELLPSEKAFAYKMKMDAMRRQGVRSDLTSDQNGPKLSTWSIGEESGISGTQVKRYIRLTELIPELLDYVDQKRIQFTVAVEISYIDQEIQKWLYEYIRNNGTVKLNQIGILRTQLQAGAMTEAKMIMLLNNSQPGKAPTSKLTFTEKKLREYFPAGFTTTEMRTVIEDLLSEWKQRQDGETGGVEDDDI